MLHGVADRLPVSMVTRGRCRCIPWTTNNEPQGNPHEWLDPFLRVGLVGCLCCVSVVVRLSLADTAGAMSPAESSSCFRPRQRSMVRDDSRRLRESQDGPLATLTAARNAVRRLKAAKSLPGGVAVMPPGWHVPSGGAVGPDCEDGGSEGQPVTYSAYPGHASGAERGRVVSDWKPFQGKIIETIGPK